MITQESPTSYQVHISQFDGPLELLWHLIQERKIDILDIPISLITHDYLSYLHNIELLPLSDATNFYYTAAQLISIKSRMLLGERPQKESEDPRRELVTQLIEYQRIKKLSQRMAPRITRDNRSIARLNQRSARLAHLASLGNTASQHPSGRYSIRLLASVLQKLINRQQIAHLFPITRPIDLQKMMTRLMDLTALGIIQLKALIDNVEEERSMEALIAALHTTLFAASQKLILLSQARPFSAIYIQKRDAT